MKSIFHKLLLIACALHLSGAHWAVLQVTAWTGMLVVRSQTSGVAEAVATTFDGEHPCSMCSAITAGQNEERQQQTEAPALKAMQEVQIVICEGAALPPLPVVGEAMWPEFFGVDLRRMEAPPVPPPVA